MTIQQALLITSMVSTALPVGAVVIRGRSRPLLLTTALLSITTAVLLGLILSLLHASEPDTVVAKWILAMATPVVLAAYAFTLVFGRENPADSLHASRRNILLLAIVGVALLCGLSSRRFVSGVAADQPSATILLGYIGKAYLTYIMCGLVFIGYNLEKTLRVAPPEMRTRMHLPLLGMFFTTGYAAFVLVSGMLYSSLGLGKMVAAGLPVSLTSILVGYGYMRGSLTDVAAPVSRKLVYSSFTALAAGLFVIAAGLAAQVAVWTNSSPDEVLIISSGILILLAGTLLIFSHRFQRLVRRFIDRNFYVNRYDYRSQWSFVTESFASTSDRQEVLDRAVTVLESVFLADVVTISLVDRGAGDVRPVTGKGVGRGLALRPDTPLFDHLSVNRNAIILDRAADDFAYIPIYAEHDDWLDGTASQVLVPLLEGGQLLGVVGIARTSSDDPFTYEDATLLESVAAHIASTLRACDLARELAETREMELISQWSSMLLHDLKNHLAPLRMAVRNLQERGGDPEVSAVCAEDLDRVAVRMQRFVNNLSELRQSSERRDSLLDPNELVKTALAETAAGASPAIEVTCRSNAAHHIRGDETMLLRVVVNLVTNAVESMPHGGSLTIETAEESRASGDVVVISVEDSGEGMTEEFLRDRLFRPFSTTKRGGLGLGVYQSRLIVQAHRGELVARSHLGTGTQFKVVLPAAISASRPERSQVPESTGGEVAGVRVIQT